MEINALSNTPKQVDPKELEQAFSLFNEASAQLTGAYQELQQQVERLTGELAVANVELRRQLLEKGALSQRLSHLLSAMPAGVVVLDQQGAIIELNPAARELLGGSLMGRAWGEIAARVLVQTVTPREWELAPVGGAVPRRVSISSSPLDAAGGQVLLIHDMTEAHKMQRELQRHQRLSAMGEMAAGLAHQLRTPLATALLYASHLKKLDLPENERIRFADKVLARLRYLEHLIQDMLSFVKGEGGGQDVVRISFMLVDLQQVMEPQMIERGLNFRIQDDSRGSVVLGSRKALTGALLNLLENAMQACSEGGQVGLRSEVGDDGQVSIAVVDNGKGIEAATQERLFEPFYTTRTDGTGLGLAIVRGVAEAHRGSVQVKSAPGCGSEFILRLPKL
ncbi:MAG: PAS domain-containing sensor histidine kinase [Betaproteobacteria bacterium CG2_30_59_46]|nr:MAG: PAS domain-containing sensor histidine kinase [Betaproteobacteria bacterium CG2_30_59_46]